MPVIKSGSSGFVAEVNSEGQLLSRAIIESEFDHISEHQELSYVWSSVTYDYAAGDTILLVQNTSTDKELHIERIVMSGDTATEVISHTTDGVTLTPAGTAVVGVNLNRQSGKIAEAIAKADETNNTQGNVVNRRRMAANQAAVVDYFGALILGNAQSIGVDFVTDGAACNVTIYGYYKDIE